MCSCIGRIPSSEQASSQVLRDKALLCSPSEDGMISWLRASVLMFFSFALVVLPVYVILSITLGICFFLLLSAYI